MPKLSPRDGFKTRSYSRTNSAKASVLPKKTKSDIPMPPQLQIVRIRGGLFSGEIHLFNRQIRPAAKKGKGIRDVPPPLLRMRTSDNKEPLGK